ncbi:MAG: peptidase C1, partial [Bacteroidia bacterium]|nr:peptidase C1 [Bacteroidia bacterium]
MKILLIFICIPLLSFRISSAQGKKDKSRFIEQQPGYYENSILKDIRVVDDRKKPEKKAKIMKVDMTEKELPNKIELYKTIWHNPSISQGNSGSCWCFSTTSYFESEIYRLTEYIQTRGESVFEQGSEANAVTRMYKLYGAVPLKIYNGLTEGRIHHTHEKMFNEMKDYLEWVKKNNAWDETSVISTIKSIMNFYLGAPPAEFEWEGEKYTPKSFLSEYIKINMADFVDVISYMQEPYWEKVEYKVPDNWWHSKEYYNVPLDDFMKIFKEAIHKGYSVVVGGDVSEAGFDKETQCAIVPTF